MRIPCLYQMLSLIMLFVIFITLDLQAGDSYIWVDKDGVTNITDTPPPENMVQKVIKGNINKNLSPEDIKNTPYPKIDAKNKKYSPICRRLRNKFWEIQNESLQVLSEKMRLTKSYGDIVFHRGLPKSEIQEIIRDFNEKVKKIDNRLSILEQNENELEEEERKNNCPQN